MSFFDLPLPLPEFLQARRGIEPGARGPLDMGSPFPGEVVLTYGAWTMLERMIGEQSAH